MIAPSLRDRTVRLGKFLRTAPPCRDGLDRDVGGRGSGAGATSSLASCFAIDVMLETSEMNPEREGLVLPSLLRSLPSTGSRGPFHSEQLLSSGLSRI